MILNKIKYFTTTLCLLLIFACTTRDDEYTPPEGTVAVPFIITSIVEANNDRELQSRKGFEIDLLDASIGTTDDRTWGFPEGAVQITSGDVNSKKIKIKLLTAGNLDVILNKTDDISGEAVSATVTIIVLEGTSASYTAVPTNPIVTGFSYDPATGTIIVEAGTEVQFTTTETGGLDTFSWKFPGQAPQFSNEKDPVVIFKKLGESEYNFRAQSAVPFGDIRLPFYSDTDEEAFYKVIVNPSSQPLTVSPLVVENETDGIEITYSRDLDPSTIDPPSNFTLTVDGVSATIQSIVLDPDDASKLVVKPTIPIKNFQNATIMYNANTLISTDGVSAPSVPLTDIVIFEGDNLFPKGDFEAATTNNYDVNNGFLGTNAGQVSADFVDGAGVDNSRAVVFSSLAGASAGSRRVLFGDKDSADVNILTPVEDNATYIIKMDVTYTGVAPQQVNFGFVKLPFSGGSRVQIQLNGTLVENEFTEFTAEFVVKANTQPDMYALPNVTIGGGPSTITYDNVRVFKKDI